MTIFKDRFKQLRKEKELTQQEIADAVDVSFTLVSAWERGERLPSVGKLEQLADFFGVSVDYLLCREEQRHTAEADVIDSLIAAEPAYKKLIAAVLTVRPEKIDQVCQMIDVLNE